MLSSSKFSRDTKFNNPTNLVWQSTVAENGAQLSHIHSFWTSNLLASVKQKTKIRMKPISQPLWISEICLSSFFKYLYFYLSLLTIVAASFSFSFFKRLINWCWQESRSSVIKYSPARSNITYRVNTQKYQPNWTLLLITSIKHTVFKWISF